MDANELISQAEKLRQGAAAVLGAQEDRDAVEQAAAADLRAQAEEAEAQRQHSDAEQRRRLAVARLDVAAADVLTGLARAEQLAAELAETCAHIADGLTGVVVRCETDRLPLPRAVGPGAVQAVAGRIRDRIGRLVLVRPDWQERAGRLL
ncbi:MAG TPA: hypothetical protein VKV26_11395 [Dehalococcoidia bacterium]|nr:hypothetical protein [Dehalococcoidia bacterium]